MLTMEDNRLKQIIQVEKVKEKKKKLGFCKGFKKL
jgi:hypothetical protein